MPTITTTSLPPSTTTTKCPAGWSKFGTNCYLFSSATPTWSAAENECIRQGGHLASIHSKAEQDFVGSNFAFNAYGAWLGASNKGVQVNKAFASSGI